MASFKKYNSTTGEWEYINAIKGNAEDIEYDPDEEYSEGTVGEALNRQSATIVDKADKTAITNPNLLDNPWFTVNQRMSTSLNTTDLTYIVDRWKFARTKGSCHNDMTEGISVAWNGTDGTNGIVRYAVEKLLVGTITISALINGTIYSKTITTSSTGTFTETDLAGSNIRVKTTATSYDFVLYSTTLSNITAVKLELGSISTLAMDTAPNYAEELLKCQYYYERLGDINNLTVSIGIGFSANYMYTQFILHPKRVIPTISNKTSFRYGKNTYDMTPSDVSFFSVDNKHGIFTLKVEGIFNVGEIYRFAIAGGNYVEFSAEL